MDRKNFNASLLKDHVYEGRIALLREISILKRKKTVKEREMDHLIELEKLIAEEKDKTIVFVRSDHALEYGEETTCYFNVEDALSDKKENERIYVFRYKAFISECVGILKTDEDE